MFGLGDGISVIGLAVTLWQKHKEAKTWTQEDKLVDSEWLELAKEKGVIDPEVIYGWSVPESVERRLLAGTHEMVFALDPERKIKYRITNGHAILLARKTKS